MTFISTPQHFLVESLFMGFYIPPESGLIAIKYDVSKKLHNLLRPKEIMIS